MPKSVADCIGVNAGVLIFLSSFFLGVPVKFLWVKVFHDCVKICNFACNLQQSLIIYVVYC